MFKDTKTQPAEVSVGQRYQGWGKTWEVTRVWDVGVVDARDVNDPARTIRWPLNRFKEEVQR